MNNTNTASVNFDNLIAFFANEGGRFHADNASFRMKDTIAAFKADGTLNAALDAGIVVAIDGGYRLAPAVGMQATVRGYSDSHPYEVVAVSASGKQITLRKMAAEQDPSFKPEFVRGGFSAHCTNQSQQKWFLTSDPEGETVKANLRKDGRFHSNYGSVSLGRAVCFYDYNF